MVFKTGDVVSIKKDNKTLEFIVFRQEEKTFLVNPNEGAIEVTDDNYNAVMDIISEVWRGDERLYPNGKLTKEEKAELNALARYFTEDTCVTKVTEGLTGVTSYIRITGLASDRHGREGVDLPSFLSGKYYKGLNSNVCYPLKDLMRD